MSNFFTRRNTILLLIILAIIIIVGLFFLAKSNVAVTSDKTVTINKSYTVVARTSDKRLTNGNLTLTVTDAKITRSIVVKEQIANPVKGKVFLVIDMDIQNPYKVPLYVFPVNLFRLAENGNQKFAPSVDQGTVQIQPLSTKKSNVGFVVMPSDKKFLLDVGELDNQSDLNINF